MKNISKIGLIFVFIIVVLFSLEKVYDFFLLENRNIKASYILKEKINASILIEGNCTTYSMIYPEIIEKKTKLKTYNLAEHNSGFAENYLNLHLYLKNNKAPNYLILYVSPESFDERYNFFTSYRFSHLLNDKIVSEIVKERDPNYYKWTSIPFFNYSYYNDEIHFNAIQGVKYCYSNKHFPFLKKGNRPLDEQFDTINYTQSYILHPKFNWDIALEKYLLKIIQLARKENIKVIFYESPLYCNDIKHLKNRNEFLKKIKKIAKNNTIDYFLFDTLGMSKSKSNFISTTTLNNENAKKFTLILSKYIK